MQPHLKLGTSLYSVSTELGRHDDGQQSISKTWYISLHSKDVWQAGMGMACCPACAITCDCAAACKRMHCHLKRCMLQHGVCGYRANRTVPSFSASQDSSIILVNGKRVDFHLVDLAGSIGADFMIVDPTAPSRKSFPALLATR